LIQIHQFLFVRNFGHLIGVKGGDSGGKSVSRCDPTESEANEEAHGPPRKASAWNGNPRNLCF